MKKFLMIVVFSFIMVFSNVTISNAVTETFVTNGYTVKVIEIMPNHMSIVEVSYNSIVIRFLWTRSGLTRIN